MAGGSGWNRGTGKAVAWLREHVSYQGDDCLTWPFYARRGYGQFQHEGTHYWAHRYMCELVNGPPPGLEYQAAHSCGNGHLACVNPKHLTWKTPSANQLDRRQHGTASRFWRWTPKMTIVDAVQIKAMKGLMTQDKLAEIFGVCRRTITSIQSGKTWRNGNSSKPGTSATARWRRRKRQHERAFGDGPR